MEDEEFLDCLHNKNTTKCLACTGNRCNQEVRLNIELLKHLQSLNIFFQSYPRNRLSCHVCTSSISAECETKPDASQACLLYSPNDNCISSVDFNGITIRGCSSQLSCNTSDSIICQECQGDNCNVANLKRKADGKPGQWQSLPLTCLSCNNLEDCKFGSSQQVCSDLEYCMTIFNNNGEVVKRGCSDGVENDQGSYCDLNSSNCLNCNSNLCNKAGSISSYIDCIYCDSKTSPDCALNPSVVESRRKCLGGCMTALYPSASNSLFDLVRTCLDDKDADDQTACSSGTSTQCKSCSTDVCNTQKLPENRLSCNHCRGENCEDAQPSECSKYRPNDQCFILFNNLSDIVHMGCTSDLGDDFVSNNLHLLYICGSEDNCNSYDNIPKPTLCAVCNSNDDEDCASNPRNVPNVATCSALPNTQCYTKLLKGMYVSSDVLTLIFVYVNFNFISDGSTQRGCVNSLTETQINACLGGTDGDCSVCEGDKCNIEVRIRSK